MMKTAQIIPFPAQAAGRLTTSILSMGNLVILLKQNKYWDRMNDNQRRLVQTAEQLVMTGEDWNEIAYYKAMMKLHHKLVGKTRWGRIRRELFKKKVNILTTNDWAGQMKRDMLQDLIREADKTPPDAA